MLRHVGVDRMRMGSMLSFLFFGTSALRPDGFDLDFGVRIKLFLVFF
jgi:hypothetical protein